MKKTNYNHFRYLMSAMLFIADVLDKDEQVKILYEEFKGQNEVLPIFKTSDRLLLIKIKQHSSKGALVFCGQCLDAFCNCNVGQIGRRLGKGQGHFSQDSDKCTFA